MFERPLEKLEYDINVIRGMIKINERLREIIKSDSSQFNTPDLQYIQENAPADRDWRIHDHCSSITRLYALYENFVEDLIENWVNILPRLFTDYRSLPENVKTQHTIGSATLLSNPRKRSRFDGLTEKEIIQNLASTEFQPEYKLTLAAFLIDDANLRPETLNKILINAGISQDPWKWIENYKVVKDFISMGGKRSMRNELENFVKWRNESSHSNVSSELDPDLLIELCDLIEMLCQAITELFLYRFVARQIELQEIQEVGQVIHWYPQPKVCEAKILGIDFEIDQRLEVGKSVYLMNETKSICRQTVIKSIKISRSGQETSEEDVLLNDIKNAKVGLKFDKDAERYLKIYV